MKITKLKAAIAAAIIIPSSAFAYQASQPTAKESIEPNVIKAVKQEKKEDKVEEAIEPVEVEVADEPVVIPPKITSIPEDQPHPVEEPAPKNYRCDNPIALYVITATPEVWDKLVGQRILGNKDVRPGEMYVNNETRELFCY